ncbi:MAG: Crp/Fnr family transcriptional regulator [Pseudolabrys sp.]
MAFKSSTRDIVPLDHHPFIARISRFMKLSETDLNCLERIIESEREIKKRRDLVVDGYEYRSLCFVKEGYAMRYKLLRNGKRQILNVIVPGDLIGFPVSLFDRSTYSVIALSDLKFNVCSINSYVGLCFERPQFGLALTWLAVQEGAIYAEHIVNIGRRTPVERLGHFLLEIHSRLLAVGLAEKASFDLPFSQEVLADVLGLSVPHLNRVMQQLRTEKLISSQGRVVELSDVTGLQTLAHYLPPILTPIPVPPKRTK